MKRLFLGNRWFYVGLALAGFMLVVALILYPLFRPIRDDWVLDGELMAVALDWRDFGDDKAEQRLDWVLSHRHLQQSVNKEDCEFIRDEQTKKVVSCRWQTEVVWPIVSWTLPLEFQSEAAIDPQGELYTP